ncbi:thermonuclease family protein [Arthrobacter glacialis]|uniref:thermonuclease family protein n=1 Tax=Arthrobacter glacialis TaxID=1664 RepID=UPI000CD3D731|nr:thermonuclease family protein [Arthrobacter glacialis]POH60171.1 hypothetical protein CVS28_04290 [Arthrobacter glacialis]
MAVGKKVSALKFGLSAGLAIGLVLGATACTKENSDTGTVVSITDGDTLVASVNGKDEKIRLLNIDTPETKDPKQPVECLGTEATDFLAGLLPVGSKITLMYDVERKDKYDRTLAAVFTPSNEFVSAEIARAGLGSAVSFAPNTKFLPPVEEAQQEAKASSRGIFDPAIACTLPAQIEAITAGLTAADQAAAPTTSAAAGAAIATAATAITTAHALNALLKAGKTGTNLVRWAAFDDYELAAHTTLLSTKIEKSESAASKLKVTQTTLEKAETQAAADAAAKQAAAEAQARADAEAKAQAAAQAQAAAEAQAQAIEEAAAREAERIRNLPPAPPVYVPPAPPVYVPPAPGSGNPSGYTGPRCYAPGGKTWRPC